MALTWFITGISSGLGRIMAETALKRGDRVAGTVRNLDAVSTLKEQYGEALWIERLDISETATISRVVDAAFAHFGQIDVVVNNAGYGLFGALEGLSDEQIENQLDTNLLGPIQVTKAAIPHLREQRGGRLIAISTYGGQAVHAGASLYHASKWGLEGFIESIALELAPFGIGATIIEPGGARTDFRAAAGRNLGQKLDAYEGTPAGMVHTVLKDASRQPNGDPEKMVSAIIASVEVTPAPRRLVLGSDAYAMVTKAISERLAEVQGQSETAPLTDVSGG